MINKMKHSITALRGDIRVSRLRSKSWKQLRSRFQSLLSEWSEYETSLALIIDYPIMADRNDPLVRRVIEALQVAQTAAQAGNDEPKAMYAEDSDFYAAVNEFEAALDAAVKHARRYGQNNLSPRNKQRLANARASLNIITSGYAQNEELEGAYENLASSLNGTIQVPEQALRNAKSEVERTIASRDLSYLPA